MEKQSSYSNLRSYPNVERKIKIRKMTVAALKVAALKDITKSNSEKEKISVMNITLGETKEYKNILEFVLSDLNEEMEIELLYASKTALYDAKLETSEWKYIFVIKEG